jgi:hypothetical protein
VTRHRDDHSLDGEPHLRGDNFKPDAREENVARRLAAEQLRRDAAEESARHSVFDEPGTLPSRPSVLIERDWSCRNCGYNLRGLMTGHRCPECGRIELYEPPREGELTYAQWLEQHRNDGSPAGAWLVAAVVPVLAVPFALLVGLVSVEHFGLLIFVIAMPAASEVLKIAIPAALMERRSSMVRHAGQIYLMALGTAVVFWIAQNFIYLTVFYKNAAPQLVAYRWFVCVFLHGFCTLIAARGLVTVCEAARREQRPVSMSKAGSFVIGAIVVHGVFNACVLGLGLAGYGF